MRFTIFSCGIFYERFANGGLAAMNIGTSTGIQNEGAYLMNPRLGTAEIVERTTSGRPVYVCLTSVYDVGRFIVAALDLGPQNWPGEYRMHGERRTVTEILQWASAVRGGRYQSPETRDSTLTYSSGTILYGCHRTSRSSSPSSGGYLLPRICKISSYPRADCDRTKKVRL